MPIKTTSPVDDVNDARPGGSFRERDSQESQHTYGDDEYKYRWIGAGDFVADDNAEHVIDQETKEATKGTMGIWTIIGDADIGTWHGVAATVWRPRKWINGTIDYTFYFSGSDNSADAIPLQIRSKSHAVGDVINASSPNLLDLTPTTITVSATPNTLVTLNVQSTNALTDDDDLFGILVERDASQFQDNDLSFYGVLLRYLPTNRQ
ncbi:MAG: hypothetical protein ACYSW3_25060 [Planctomycetota bacterium]|jgi:hypothetical protein